jgi:hypothetical protein
MRKVQQIVDGHDAQVAAFERRAKGHSPDATETVDADRSHGDSLARDRP